jgi:hypothetical protein
MQLRVGWERIAQGERRPALEDTDLHRPPRAARRVEEYA